MDTITQRLTKLGLSTEQITGVMEIITEGLDVQVTPKGFALESQFVKIIEAKVNPGSNHVYDFDVEIEGVDPAQIKSVTLPKIDYASNEIFTITVELLPLTMAKEMRLCSDALFNKQQEFKEE